MSGAPEKTQSERFKDTARELETDETGKAFERAFGKIAPPKRRRRKDKEGGYLPPSRPSATGEPGEGD